MLNKIAYMLTGAAVGYLTIRAFIPFILKVMR